MEQSNKGWVKVYRDITSHWVWQNPEYYRAWMYLLISANHKEKTWLHNGNLVKIKRGELVTSLDTLGSTFNWSRSKVRHFLKLLKKDTMIRTHSNTNYTHLSICNYDTYQDKGHSEDTTQGTAKAQPRQQLKNVKNEKNVKNRYKKFEEEVLVYKKTYPTPMIANFISYWTELNKSKTRMRFELEKTWETSKRLTTWSNNSKQSNEYSTPIKVDKIHDYVCTNGDCGNKQKSSKQPHEVECTRCGYRTLATKREAAYL